MAVIGTLLGATTSYFIQAAGYRREAGERLQTLRRQVYVDWLSQSHDFHTALRLLSAKHRFRAALEVVEMESPTLRNSPNGACTHACRFLSQYLFDNGLGDWAFGQWARRCTSLLRQSRLAYSERCEA